MTAVRSTAALLSAIPPVLVLNLVVVAGGNGDMREVFRDDLGPFLEVASVAEFLVVVVCEDMAELMAKRIP